ncbi:MAG: hypothetical protein RBQ94_01570 [Methanimicrococcus sp.]|nr:hypothetical protein [Methanimicrococcus sp.]
MSKKSLLIIVVLLFMLVATAMALENKSANENFTNQNDFGSKMISEDGGLNKPKTEGGTLPLGSDQWSGMLKLKT